MPGDKEHRAALLGGGEKVESYSYDPDDLVIADDPKDPLYDPTIHEPLEPSFVANIQTRGVRTPITITIREVNGERKAYVVVGRTRVRACRVANVNRVKEGLEPHRVLARRVDAKKEESLIEDKLDENFQRRQKEKPSHNIFRAVDLQDRGWSTTRIADKLQCSEGAVRQLLKLNDASEAVKKALDDGLPMTAALELSKLDIKAQTEAIKELRERGLDKSASGTEGGGATAAAAAIVADKAPERIVMKRVKALPRKVFEKMAAQVRTELGMDDGAPAPKGAEAERHALANEVLALTEVLSGEPLAKMGRKKLVTSLFERLGCPLPDALKVAK